MKDLHISIIVPLAFVLLGSMASSARAAIQVSEVAWMGTASSANDEWIELFNDGSEAVDLSSWTLEWEDNLVPLGSVGSATKEVRTATLAAGGYLILERTDDDSLANVTADLIYTGALGNGGETLVLKNAGITAWQFDASAGWPAGDNTNKATMQWDGAAWITAEPTPRATAGAAVAETPASAAPASSEGYVYNPPQPDVEKEYTIELRGPSYASAGSPVQLRARGIERESAVYVWSFGDGAITRGDVVWHSYGYGGVYAPVVRASVMGREYVARAKLTIFEPQITITESVAGYITLRNDSVYPTELYAWRLSGGPNTFTFPRDMVVLPGASISLSAFTTGIGGELGARLVRPDGVPVAERKPDDVRAVTIIANGTAAPPAAGTTTKNQTFDSVSASAIVPSITAADAVAPGTLLAGTTTAATLDELEKVVQNAKQQVLALASEILARTAPVHTLNPPPLPETLPPPFKDVTAAFPELDGFAELPEPWVLEALIAARGIGATSAPASLVGTPDGLLASPSTALVVPRKSSSSFLGRIGSWFDAVFGGSPQ